MINPLSNEDYLEFFRQMLDDVHATVAKKNSDYTAGSGDAFANFRLAKIEGLDPITGVLLRLQDKLQRIRAFVHSGRLAVETESVRDACMDIVGYAGIIAGLAAERSAQAKPESPPEDDPLGVEVVPRAESDRQPTAPKEYVETAVGYVRGWGSKYDINAR